MAKIDAKMVKELRERTGAGMMDCKKALAETDGDMQKAIDYLLCGYLLDRRIDVFAVNVFRYYPNNNELPKHYREALTLYMHQRTNPVVVYRNNLMETDYQDFQDLENKYKNRAERINALRSVYGNTYWFYYNYGE